MSKIGTAHIEIKPVLNEGALDDVCREIEDRVAGAIASAMGELPAGGRRYCDRCGAQIEGEGAWGHDGGCPRK